MNSPLAENSPPEKELWYQEVLSLDPSSRIFFPYARLLAENGRRAEAVEVLRSGLTRHPEFLDARLLLIDLLHESGLETAAGLEASGIIESLSQCGALWEIWSRLPGVRADQAAMLLFFGATFRKGGPGLAEVFAAGMKALQGGPDSAQTARKQAPAPSASAAVSVPVPVAVVSDEAPETSGEADAGPTLQKREEKASGPAFVMPDDAPWYSLDSVPEDDDPDDEDISPAAISPAVAQLILAGQHAAAADTATAQDERVPAVHSVPRSPLEGKSSLCTRSMAHILEEQGATGEAADIYRELLEVSSSPEERAELNAKLDSLMQGTENAVPPQSEASGIMDMLETLAVRLENKSRA